MALLLGGKGLARGQLPPDPLADLPEVAGQTSYHAELDGSGAIAQGAGAVAAGAGGVAIGKINAGRDVVVGNQYNVHGGDVTIGDRYLTVNTPAEFVVELRRLQEQVAALRQQPGLPAEQARRVEAAEAGVREALQETQQPRPLGTRIRDTLARAQADLALLSGSVGAAAGLGALLGQLGLLAIQVFGG